MVNKREIKSVESADDDDPWYEVQINNGLPEIVSDKDGSTSFDMSGVAASVPSFVELPQPAASQMSHDAIYAVTEAGEFISYEPGRDLSEHGISLRAHLAWYDSDTDEFTVLEFVEP